MTLYSKTLYARWPNGKPDDARDHNWLIEVRDHINMASSIMDLCGVAAGNPDDEPGSCSIEYAMDAAMAALSDAKVCLEMFERERAKPPDEAATNV